MEENKKERIDPCQFMNKKGKLYFGINIGKKFFIKINRKWLEINKDGNNFYVKEWQLSKNLVYTIVGEKF